MKEEIINELYLQSQIQRNTEWGENVTFFDYRKFAELIVQECLDIMKDEKHNRTMLLSNPTESGAIYDAMYNIKSHFGVK